jgi:hypothetical protein
MVGPLANSPFQQGFHEQYRESQRLPCVKCGTMALPDIIQANNGICAKFDEKRSKQL